MQFVVGAPGRGCGGDIKNTNKGNTLSDGDNNVQNGRRIALSDANVATQSGGGST